MSQIRFPDDSKDQSKAIPYDQLVLLKKVLGDKAYEAAIVKLLADEAEFKRWQMTLVAKEEKKTPVRKRSFAQADLIKKIDPNDPANKTLVALAREFNGLCEIIANYVIWALAI